MNNNFETYLKQRIQNEGPITLADYMQACLSDPDHGYYRVRDPLGALGDFITAPEISQVFGELIGIWSLSVWNSLGQPGPFKLIELGPGRGTMLNDALRAARILPGFLKNTSVHLTETSPVLRDKQKELLSHHAVEFSWHDDPENIAPGPSIIVANEFLDALPIHQLVFRGGKWFERMIGLDSKDELMFIHALKPFTNHNIIPRLPQKVTDGDILEIRPAVSEVIRMLKKRSTLHPVVALFIDYGHSQTAYGDTFQAIKNHKFYPPLKTPGEADLTSHVDFGALKELANKSGMRTYGPLTQSHFLQKLGIQQRTEQLVKSSTPDKRRGIVEGVERLVAAGKMGELFKVLVVTGGTQVIPPPFNEMSDLA